MIFRFTFPLLPRHKNVSTRSICQDTMMHLITLLFIFLNVAFSSFNKHQANSPAVEHRGQSNTKQVDGQLCHHLVFIFNTNCDVFGQQWGRYLVFLGYFEFFSLGIFLMGIKWEKHFDLRIFLGRLQLMEVVAFVGQFLPSGGGFVSIFPFGGFSWFLVVYLELLLDSLGIFVSLGRSREWLPLSHIHLGGRK